LPEKSYFVTIDGKQHGPYRATQIRSKLGQGKLAETDFIWCDGMPKWVPVGSIIAEFPGVTPPPVPEDAITRITKLTITHPNEFPTTVLDMPEKGIYEPAATLKQKNLLMKFGCKEAELLKHLGREQASFMIDAFIKDKEELLNFELLKQAEERQKHYDETSTERRKADLETAAAIIILIAIAVVGYYLLK
jgi:hypothetical protein